MKKSSEFDFYLKSGTTTASKSRKSRNEVSTGHAFFDRSSTNKTFDSAMMGGRSPYNQDLSLFLPDLSLNCNLKLQNKTFANDYKLKAPKKVTWDQHSPQNVKNDARVREVYSSHDQRRSHRALASTNKELNPTGPKIGKKVIEQWLNDTLDNADDLKIPKPLLKDRNKITCQYGIDRLTLSNAGIPEETIDRVYRCLFVYSTGFHQLLTKLMKHTEGKYRVIKNIWKTFAVLLEYC